MPREMDAEKTGFLGLDRAATRLDREDAMLSERSRAEKDRHCLMLPVCGP